ncbi:hypothetical protein K4K52_011773 [Colletotrichum sp. SAR 10_76]|nr:hypothetical protein K4K52_011773 [Colletotrichum sp. SAR 10_76]
MIKFGQFKASLLPTNEHDWARLLGFLTSFSDDANQSSPPPFVPTVLLVSTEVLSGLLRSLAQDRITTVLGHDLDISVHFYASPAVLKDLQTCSLDDGVWKTVLQGRVTTSGLSVWCEAQDKSSRLTARTIFLCDVDQATKPDAWGPGPLKFFATDNEGIMNEIEGASEDLKFGQTSDSGSSATADGEEPEW